MRRQAFIYGKSYVSIKCQGIYTYRYVQKVNKEYINNKEKYFMQVKLLRVSLVSSGKSTKLLQSRDN